MSTDTKSSKKWFNTLKFLAAYLVAAWTFLQFVDWILNRYSISPYWVDILLWLFIGIIPSLIIYLHHRERINKRILKLREKIIFPLNIVLLIVIIYFGFGNSDLGATTKEISFENAEGQKQIKTITKEEFRIGIPIYNFKQITEDSTTRWMANGICKLLYEDLLQNKNISPNFAYYSKTSNKIREASLFYSFYVDGAYQKVDNDYKITTYIRKSSNGKILKEDTFIGPDFLTLLDDISVFITANAGFIENSALNYIDLPINEFISNSLPAIEAYTKGDYKKAYAIDNNFALAYLEEAKRSTAYNKGKLETQDLIDKASALKNKLPLQKQLEVYIQKNLAYDNFEEAERLVNLQLEVDPNNDFYNNVRYSIYGETKNTKRYFETAEELFNNDPSATKGLDLALAALVSGHDDDLLNALKPFEVINPNIKALKLEPLIFKGKIDEAIALLKDLKIQHPDYLNRAKTYDSILGYLKNNTPKNEDLKQFIGTYRSGVNEQVVKYWIENDRLIQFTKNQNMRALLPAGSDAIGGGFIQNTTFYYKLAKDVSGKIIGFYATQHNWNNSGTRFYWKIDPHISAANDAFTNKNLIEAEQLYDIAIANNPSHKYLNNILNHIRFLNNSSNDTIRQQHENFSGNYGPRKFWIEDGKFYYKRKGNGIDLARVELLPIGENRYMDLTRLSTVMNFETNDKGQIASVPYSFNSETMKWDRLDGETNYYLKD